MIDLTFKRNFKYPFLPRETVHLYNLLFWEINCPEKLRNIIFFLKKIVEKFNEMISIPKNIVR